MTTLVLIHNVNNPELCSATISSLLASATSPSSLKISLLDSPDTNKKAASCIDTYCEKNPASAASIITTQVAQAFIHSTHNAYAVALRAALTPSITHVLTVDPGVLFEQGWDQTLKTDAAALPTNSVISYAPSSSLSSLCGVTFTKSQSPASQSIPPPPASSSATTPTLSAGLSTSLAYFPISALLASPFDPFLSATLTPAADLSLYVRLFSRGVDVYSPSVTVARREGKTHYPVVKAKDEKGGGAMRLNTILQLGNGNGPAARATLGQYGVGSLRPWSAATAFLRVDFDRKVATADCSSPLVLVPVIPQASLAQNDVAYSCLSPDAPPGCADNVDPPPVYPLLNPPSPLPHPSSNSNFANFNPGSTHVVTNERSADFSHYMTMFVIIAAFVCLVASLLQCVKELGHGKRVNAEKLRALRNPTSQWGQGVGKIV